MRFSPLGDRAVMITLGDSIDEPTHRRVQAVAMAVEASRGAGAVMGAAVTDVVPAFVSVVVHYDLARVLGNRGLSPYDVFTAWLEQLLAGVTDAPAAAPRVVEIPVCYGGELGPDLEDVAHRHALSPEDVVRLHVHGDYMVYMVGFMPGFAYLGGLAAEIATPRRSTPRMAVPAGTVGIGGDQTGVYPLTSPGGWNLIGKTPLKIFDIARPEPSLLAAGDRVRFHPISPSQFRDWPA